VSLNQMVSAADINAGNLQFTPAANANGAGYASFNFLVHDGTTYSALSYTMTVDVLIINLPDLTLDQTVQPSEDTNDDDNDEINNTKNEIPLNVSNNLSNVKRIFNNIEQNFYISGLQNKANISVNFEIEKFQALDKENESYFDNKERLSYSDRGLNSKLITSLDIKNKNLLLSNMKDIEQSYYEYFTTSYEAYNYHDNLRQTITVAGFTVGLISTHWILSSNFLLGSMFASASIWRSIDPFPILSKKRRNDNKKNNIDDEYIESIFEK